MKPDGSWPPKAALRAAFDKAEAEFLPAFSAKRQEGRFTPGQLNFGVSHAIIKNVADQLGMKYNVERWN